LIAENPQPVVLYVPGQYHPGQLHSGCASLARQVAVSIIIFLKPVYLFSSLAAIVSDGLLSLLRRNLLQHYSNIKLPPLFLCCFFGWQ